MLFFLYTTVPFLKKVPKNRGVTPPWRGYDVISHPIPGSLKSLVLTKGYITLYLVLNHGVFVDSQHSHIRNVST